MRTTRKRLLSIFLVVMMMFSLVPTMALGAAITLEAGPFGSDGATLEINGAVEPLSIEQAAEILDVATTDINGYINPGFNEYCDGSIFAVSVGEPIQLSYKENGSLVDNAEWGWENVDGRGAYCILPEVGNPVSFEAKESGAFNIYAGKMPQILFVATTDYTAAYTKDETRYIIHFDTNEMEGMNVTAGRSVADKSVTTPYYLFMGTEFMRDRYHLNYALFSDEYDWLGWYDNAELTGDPVYRMTIAGNTALYAKWKGIPAEFADTPEGLTFQLSRDYVYVLENGMPYLPDTILRATITLPNGFADAWVNQKANDRTMTQAVLDVRDNTNAEEYVLNLKGSELLKLHEAKLDLVVQTNYGVMTIPWEDLDVLGQQATKGDAANAGEGNKSGYDPDIRITINEDGAAAKKRTKATGTFVAVHPNAVKVDYNQETALEIDTDAGETYKPDVTVIENDQMKKPEKPYTAMIQMALQ